MRKTLMLIVLLVTCFCFSAFGESVKENDITNEAFKFRDFEWGTSLEDVQNKEITDTMVYYDDYYTSEDAYEFIIRTVVSDIDMFAHFAFDEDWKLRIGYYEPNVTHSTPLDYYKDFAVLDTLLISLYGNATVEYNVGFDDFASLSTEEKVNSIINNGAVIANMWGALDGSCIMSGCYASEGIIHTGLYYFEDYNTMVELLNSVMDTTGL